ncbi:hypothetical protein RHSIM_Rhsim06G0110000 [Rhododendron simsii]|uniref:GrpE protein homolog n=1 Tax=Rhododendron simsii TaxID=118357 RepID=A0A834LNA8_RHOSS|nr:hypothetical protein RHSIM_Rhsim06G0110000 [Rhododendron simsii]
MAMAVSISNNFSLCSTPSPCVSFSHSASTPPSKTHKPQFHKTLVALKPHLNRPHLILSKPPRVLGFNLSSLPPFNRNNYRPSFTSSLALQDSTFQTNDDEGQPNDSKLSESKADPRGTLSLKSLINVYKEALLGGNEKAISEVEAMICIAENEKNELVQKLSAMSAEIKSGNEKYIRLQADFDNFRKRTEKERLTIRGDAQGDVIESLLPMVDSFERAKQQIKPETEKEKKIDTSYQGIYKQFVEILRSFRVAVVPTVGKRFDPSVHEAIAREESQEFKEGFVSQELRRGFLLGDRLVRPAMVKVSTGPRKEKPTAATGKSTGQPTAAAGLDNR